MAKLKVMMTVKLASVCAPSGPLVARRLAWGLVAWAMSLAVASGIDLHIISKPDALLFSFPGDGPNGDLAVTGPNQMGEIVGK